MVVFHRLDESHIERIVDIQVDQLRERLAEREPRPRAERTRRARTSRTVGYDPDFGARPLKRVLQREISDPIALALLKGEFHDGDIIVVDANADGELDLQCQETRHHRLSPGSPGNVGPSTKIPST